MEIVKEFEKFIEGNTKKMSELFSNFSASNPLGDWANTYYKDIFAKTQEMFTSFFNQDVYSKLLKEAETFQKDIVEKFSGLTKDTDEFKKIQKQFEEFMVGNSKKFLDVANSTFKEGYDKLNKTIQDNLGKLDFSKLLTLGVAEKKTTQASTGTKKA